MRERIAEAESEHAGLGSEIETFDDQSAPMSEKRTQLEAERRQLVDKIEELEDVRRRHENRRDLLEARRRDIEETAGSRTRVAPSAMASGMLPAGTLPVAAPANGTRRMVIVPTPWTRWAARTQDVPDATALTARPTCSRRSPKCRHRHFRRRLLHRRMT